MLWDARFSYKYMRVNMNKGIYITINFNRDGLVDIMTNSRSILLWKEIQTLRNLNTITRLIDFTFRWVNQLNK